MTVGELKRILKDEPDHMLVVAPSSDHSFREVTASVGTAGVKGSHLSEWFSAEDNPGEAEIYVLVVE